MKDFSEFLSLLSQGINLVNEQDLFAKEIETCLRDMLRDAARLSYLNGDMSKSQQDEYFKVIT